MFFTSFSLIPLRSSNIEFIDLMKLANRGPKDSTSFFLEFFKILHYFLDPKNVNFFDYFKVLNEQVIHFFVFGFPPLDIFFDILQIGKHRIIRLEKFLLNELRMLKDKWDTRFAIFLGSFVLVEYLTIGSLSMSQKNGCSFSLLRLYFCSARNVAMVLLALQ